MPQISLAVTKNPTNNYILIKMLLYPDWRTDVRDNAPFQFHYFFKFLIDVSLNLSALTGHVASQVHVCIVSIAVKTNTIFVNDVAQGKHAHGKKHGADVHASQSLAAGGGKNTLILRS